MLMRKLLSNPKIREFIRFCIVGIIATGLHYGIYLALIYSIRLENEIWTNAAYTLGYVISFCCNMWLTAHFTFKEQLNVKKGAGFAVSHAINYGLHIGFLNLFLWLGVPEQWAPIPVYCLVVPINFLLVRIVFKKIK